VRFDAKAVRQSPITVRLGTDSVNPFRQQIYKSLVSVALKPQNRTVRAAGSGVGEGIRQPTCIITTLGNHKTAYSRYMYYWVRRNRHYRASTLGIAPSK